MHWHQKAAEQGNAVALYNLGVMYDKGQGVDQDDEQAVALPKGIKVGHGEITALAGILESGGTDLTRFQFDAPIQSGNSGGPLLDNAGNVIGMTVESINVIRMMLTRGTVPQNVNFAIRGSLLRVLLDIHDVDYRWAGPRRLISRESRAAIAREFVEVQCWE